MTLRARTIGMMILWGAVHSNLAQEPVASTDNPGNRHKQLR